MPIRLLYVDDDEIDAEMTRRALKAAPVGVEFFHAHDGLEALAFLREGRQGGEVPRPDLIILDLNMPQMDGPAFLAELRGDASLSDLPVAMLVSSPSQGEALQADSPGPDGFLIKPIDRPQFERLLETLGLPGDGSVD